ncbi:MAG: hypothetical protein ABSF35_21045 [Polyangia bacterium]|jgi:hypothetical protein
MPELARELRRALDELGALVEDANKHACVVEDAFGLDDPVADFERLGEAEQAKARTELPGVLEALAELGNRIHRQLWVLGHGAQGPRRGAAGGAGKALAEEDIMRSPDDGDLEDDDESDVEGEFENDGFDEIEEDDDEDD